MLFRSRILKHRLLQAVALPLVLGMLMLSCERQSLPAEPPNIVFIFMDDHASHSISAYGSNLVHTPNIDRLAEEGMLFQNAFVTNSICAPSRGVLLTGKHSHINGQITNMQRFDGSQMTFAQELQRSGYQTAMIGKWHLQSDPTGYDHWEILPGQGTYYNPVFITPEGRNQYEGYVTDIITDKVLEWIDAHKDSGKPFLVNYHHKAPHRTWKPAPRHLGMFDDVDIPEPPTLFANWANELSDGSRLGDLAPDSQLPVSRTSGVETNEMSLMDHFSYAWDLKFPVDSVQGTRHWNLWNNHYSRFTDEQKALWDQHYTAYYQEYKELAPEGRERLSWVYQRYIKDYISTIVAVDENVGRLLDYLEENGLADNTVVVYTSDQGFFLGDHGWYDKRWMYEESLHIPLLVRWPAAIAPGSVNNKLVQNIDFAPTLIDLARLQVPEDVQGRSLVPLLTDQEPDEWRESLYYHYYEYPGEHRVPRHYGVRTLTHKLIHYYQLGEWELFDLQNDPYEVQNRYDDPAFSDVRDALKQELYRLREHYQVPDEDPV